jgi:hypothetical protein
MFSSSRVRGVRDSFVVDSLGEANQSLLLLLSKNAKIERKNCNIIAVWCGYKYCLTTLRKERGLSVLI